MNTRIFGCLIVIALILLLAPPGMAANGTISGFKWYDLNRDGFFDESEGYLSGWTITIANQSNSSSTVVASSADLSSLHRMNRGNLTANPASDLIAP